MRKIAISSCFQYADKNRGLFSPKILTYMESEMAEFCSQKDSMPILIPNFDDARIDRYLDECSGLLLHGGSDLCPESYGEAYLDKDRWPGDKYRDDYELRLIPKAIQRGLPIFGVCRGFQLINVFFGGKIYQDLPTQTQTQVEHRNGPLYDQIFHDVKLTGSLFQSLYTKETITVNSIHHQGVSQLGAGLEVQAICEEDQLIEAFTHKKYPIFGVQWHPEFNHTLKGTVDPAQPLFDHFISLMRS